MMTRFAPTSIGVFPIPTTNRSVFCHTRALSIRLRYSHARQRTFRKPVLQQRREMVRRVAAACGSRIEATPFGAAYDCRSVGKTPHHRACARVSAQIEHRRSFALDAAT